MANHFGSFNELLKTTFLWNTEGAEGAPEQTKKEPGQEDVLAGFGNQYSDSLSPLGYEGLDRKLFDDLIGGSLDEAEFYNAHGGNLEFSLEEELSARGLLEEVVSQEIPQQLDLSHAAPTIPSIPQDFHADGLQVYMYCPITEHRLFYVGGEAISVRANCSVRVPLRAALALLEKLGYATSDNPEAILAEALKYRIQVYALGNSQQDWVDCNNSSASIFFSPENTVARNPPAEQEQYFHEIIADGNDKDSKKEVLQRWTTNADVKFIKSSRIYPGQHPSSPLYAAASSSATAVPLLDCVEETIELTYEASVYYDPLEHQKKGRRTDCGIVVLAFRMSLDESLYNSLGWHDLIRGFISRILYVPIGVISRKGTDRRCKEISNVAWMQSRSPEREGKFFPGMLLLHKPTWRPCILVQIDPSGDSATVVFDDKPGQPEKVPESALTYRKWVVSKRGKKNYMHSGVLLPGSTDEEYVLLCDQTFTKFTADPEDCDYGLRRESSWNHLEFWLKHYWSHSFYLPESTIASQCLEPRWEEVCLIHKQEQLNQQKFLRIFTWFASVGDFLQVNKSLWNEGILMAISSSTLKNVNFQQYALLRFCSQPDYINIGINDNGQLRQGTEKVDMKTIFIKLRKSLEMLKKRGGFSVLTLDHKTGSYQPRALELLDLDTLLPGSKEEPRPVAVMSYYNGLQEVVLGQPHDRPSVDEPPAKKQKLKEESTLDWS